MTDMAGLWIKTIQRGDHTQTYYAELHSNGTATERHFFAEDHNRDETWPAKWMILKPMKRRDMLCYHVPTEHGLYVSLVHQEWPGLWMGDEGRLEPGDQRGLEAIRDTPWMPAEHLMTDTTRVAFTRVSE
ncbi:hypothetical protein G3I13_02095 [Streptomyces sp. SID6673]|nr:hypothetical protein [Streptomyces sp. SID11726]NDZ94955.1 hypothetical protein [Streptomyces sp. SID11726]NEB23113.1 hypothetical protein [Streptomyces sp. SID6673]